MKIPRKIRRDNFPMWKIPECEPNGEGSLTNLEKHEGYGYCYVSDLLRKETISYYTHTVNKNEILFL
jgi:hypothetical protein